MFSPPTKRIFLWFWAKQGGYKSLLHIHNLGFAHRNLKPKNLFIDEKDDFNLKIADFVFASNLNENSKTFVGTIDYMAPEIHLKMHH